MCERDNWPNGLELSLLSFMLLRRALPILRTNLQYRMSYSTVSTPNAPSAIGPYSQAIKTDSLIFLSGCIPLDPASMKVVEGGVEEQTVRGNPAALERRRYDLERAREVAGSGKVGAS